ncbi:MAG: 50S ribosomal protein L5 [Elusimicrobia bacterium]|nr:50S ribosomal protein L5 [Elusimicrobiota bacterium]
MEKEEKKDIPKTAGKGKPPSAASAGKPAAKPAPAEPLPKDYKPRLRTAYDAKIAPVLMKNMGCTSIMGVPRLKKIVLNVGVTEAKENIQALDQMKDDLSVIAGQSPQMRRAKRSISNFKLRKGMPIGLKVTLRGCKMYEFFDRFVSIAVPRIRDFQGFESACFDGCGNLNIGLKEHHIFPEINIEKSPKAKGMNITFVTDAASDERAKMLFEHMGMPFKKQKKD